MFNYHQHNITVHLKKFYYFLETASFSIKDSFYFLKIALFKKQIIFKLINNYIQIMIKMLFIKYKKIKIILW